MVIKSLVCFFTVPTHFGGINKGFFSKMLSLDTGKLDVFKEILFTGWNKREAPRTF